jgi:hypothetical protein
MPLDHKGTPFRNEAKANAAAAATMKSWIGIPANLHLIAHTFEADGTLWHQLLDVLKQIS